MTDNWHEYAIQTVDDFSGKTFWSRNQFPTMGEAMTYIQKRCNEGRRILIWRESNQDHTIDLIGYMKDKHSDVIEVKS